MKKNLPLPGFEPGASTFNKRALTYCIANVQYFFKRKFKNNNF